MHYCIRSHGELSCLHCPRDCGRVTAKVTTKLTSTITLSLILTFPSSLCLMNIGELCDVSTSRLYQMTIVIILLKTFFEVLFDATHFETRPGNTIRQFWKTVFISGDA